jgi:UDP-2,4-diacetamido-2,4,6-trideoxy-beta-L-altropyranose hydrolase
MRCLNLAQALKDNNSNVMFVCRDLPGNITHRIEEAGFSVMHILCDVQGNHYVVDQSVDANATLDTMKSMMGVTMIVDHYGLTIEWQRLIKARGVRVVVIDDLADRPHECDLLVNANQVPDIWARYKRLLPAYASVLTGPSYALLSSCFSAQRPSSPAVPEHIKRVVIFFGASDLSNVTRKSLQAAINANVAQIDVIIGNNHPDRDSLQALVEGHPSVHLLGHQPDFAATLAGADLMIGAGGVTQLERCSLGVPGIVIAIADNQLEPARGLHEAGACVYLGWHEDVTVENIEEQISILADQSRRQAMAKTGWDLVDGNGATRVCDTLLEPALILRRATMTDVHMMYLWRNDPVIRAQSHTKDVINFANHEMWLSASLKNPQRDILIAEREGVPVGVLRFDIMKKIAEVSIYLDPGAIGGGIGVQLLRAGTNWLIQNRPGIAVVSASILPENIRSQNAFLRAGYQYKKQGGTDMILQLEDRA